MVGNTAKVTRHVLVGISVTVLIILFSAFVSYKVDLKLAAMRDPDFIFKPEQQVQFQIQAEADIDLNLNHHRSMLSVKK